MKLKRSRMSRRNLNRLSGTRSHKRLNKFARMLRSFFQEWGLSW